MKNALSYKDEGNVFFKDRKYENAVEKYQFGLDHIKDVETDEANKLKIILYQNSATSLNYLGEGTKAMDLCNKAIAINDKSWKAWFQRGLANFKL